MGEKFLLKSVRKTGMSECDNLDITSCLLFVSVCADDNVCLSRVMSPSPQFVWKYSTGKFTRIEGDGKTPFLRKKTGSEGLDSNSKHTATF